MQPLNASLKASLKIWLNMQCQMLGNVSAAMLAQISETAPAVVAKWPQGASLDAHLREALLQVASKGRLHLALVDDQLVLGQPLIMDDQLWGVLVIRLDSTDKKALPAILKNLKLGQFWLQFLLQQAALNQHAQVAATSTAPGVSMPALPVLEKSDADAALLQLSASLLKENSLQEMAISLVNLLAGFLQATRVSLGLYGRAGITLEAISFSANFDKRTQSMQAIADAMAEAAEQGMGIDFSTAPVEPATGGNPLPSSIKHAHQQLLQQQQLQAVHTLLLRKGGAIIGALTIELDKQQALDNAQRVFVQQSLQFASAILALQQQASASVWRGVKQRLAQRLSRWLGEDSWRGKLIAGTLLMFVVVLFVPVEYRLSADASLQTTEKHWVVAPQDGYLGKVLVRPGDAVTKGAPLAQLNDEDLRLERRKLASQVQQYRQAYDTALANSLRVEAAIASAQMEQASIQLRLIDQQLERTQLVAPMDGIIVSDDISQTQGAPVKQGDLLFEVAAATGFLVQLFVDERDIAAVQVGQEGEVKLTSLPNELFTLRVKTITPISEVREGRNYFRVDAALVTESAALRPGMSGSGKLQVGRRALGWIWFHELWYWLRLSVW
ncbi:MAG: efflux RND transporter periplasmic adaptor subunit [Cellvibrio sp.]|uniref:efflux RND transporter periplasmic adaptor subunit n=1 Tax=Cellvibrio sp. TaxID=1965322 RepID=UPI0027264444|nr:efflux RND transporter periplasmic adaptor subunit [Cellvibrio sp.]